jgi:hypothetical protein
MTWRNLEKSNLHKRWKFQLNGTRLMVSKSMNQERTQETFMPELDDRERSLLKALANEWDRSGPPGFLETTAIAETIGITTPDAKKTIHSLFVKGLVGTDKIDIYAAYLLPEGYEIARAN